MRPIKVLLLLMVLIGAWALAPVEGAAMSVGAAVETPTAAALNAVLASEFLRYQSGDTQGSLPAPSWKKSSLARADQALLHVDRHGRAVGPQFFADVFRVRSAFRPSCQDCADPSRPSPEPATLLLFGAALAGIGLLVRRRLRRADVAPDNSP